MTHSIFLYIFFLLIIYGCVSIPKYELARLSSCGESIVTNISYDWWKEFKDPLLDKLIESGLEKSPTLKLAEERLKAVYQIALQSRSSLYPEVDIEVIDTWYHLSKNGFFRALAPSIPAVVNDFTMGLSFSYEFDFWNKNRSLFNAALSRTTALVAERAQAELILTTSIAYSYLELQFLLLERHILSQQQTNRQRIYNMINRRKIEALDTKIETNRGEIFLLEITTLLLKVEQEIERHIHQLKALTGLGEEVELAIPLSELKGISLGLFDNISLNLIARRPDLMAQKALVEAHAKEIDAAKTDFYPNINLNALIGLESITWSKLFRASSYSATITPAFNLPIFTAGRLQAQLREKVADFNAAVQGYNGLILTAAQELADCLTDIALIEQEIVIEALSLDNFQSTLYLTRERFQHALADRIAVLQAEDAFLKSQLSLAVLKYSRQFQFVLLIRALGGGS